MLVDNLQSQLEFSRIKSGRHRAEVARPLVKADASIVDVALELRMVPGVEGLRPEFNSAAALRAEYEVFQKRQVPVVAARTAQRIKPKIPPRAGSRGRKHRRVKPFGRRLRIRNRSVYIWPITLLSGRASIWNDAGHRAAAHPQIDRRSRFHGNDSRQCPSSHRRPKNMVVAVLQERNL